MEANETDVKDVKDINLAVKQESDQSASEEEVQVNGDTDRRKRTADVLQEDAVENGKEKTPAKRSRGRPRGGGGDHDGVINKTAKIVLQPIDIGGQGDQLNVSRGSPRGRGRGRGARGATRGTTRSGRTSKPVKVKDSDEDDDVDYEEDDPDEEPSEDDDDEEEEFVPSKKGRGRGKSPGRGRGSVGRGGGGGGRGRGAGKTKAKPAKDTAENSGEEDEDEGEAEEDPEVAEEAAANDPDAIRTGQFLIDKRDTKHVENYPIWRLEGPNMLRKFELVVQLGRIRHKSLYAYSSWAQTMRDMFNKLQVTQISSVDGEIVVEIDAKDLPQPPELPELEAKYANHEHLQLYKTVMRILFQQAADSNFLINAYSQEAPDSSVQEPMSKIDAMVREGIKKIESAVNFKEDFKTRIQDCPNMKSIRRSNWSQTDQSTLDKLTEKGVRSVLLFGFGYDQSTMVEDKSRGAEVASEIVIGDTTEKYLLPYHGLTHFKLHLLRRCQDKAKLLASLQDEQPSIDKCMEDECWVLAAFEEFLQLLTPPETNGQA